MLGISSDLIRYIFVFLDQVLLSKTCYLLESVGAQKVVVVIHTAQEHVSTPDVEEHIH